MHALVATARHLLIVDLNSKSVEVVEAGRPEYYGISWFAGEGELVLSHSGLDNYTLTDIAAYAASEVGYLSKGKDVTRSFLSQPHQIICANDGQIVVTNTGRNCIQVIEFGRPNVYREVMLSNIRWDRLSIEGPFGDHLNSVFLRDNRLYVVAHGHREGSRLAVYSFPELILVSVEAIPTLRGVHNVFVDRNNRAIGCASEVGALADLRTGELLWRSGSGVYTRGLAASTKSFFIGESKYASRRERNMSDAGLWIVDRETFEAQDYLYLGPYGAVHEVRLVDVPDDAHHGTEFAGGVRAIRNRLATSRRAEKLAVASVAQKNIGTWSDFHVSFGLFDELEGGWRRSANCMLAVTRTGVSTIGIDYRIDAADVEGHVSVVAGYRGVGDDVLMDAFLLQANGAQGYVRRYTHDGNQWIAGADVLATGLPLQGELTLSVDGENWTLASDGKPIARGSDLNAGNVAAGRLGVRASEVAIRPARHGR